MSKKEQGQLCEDTSSLVGNQILHFKISSSALLSSRKGVCSVTHHNFYITKKILRQCGTDNILFLLEDNTSSFQTSLLNSGPEVAC